MVLLRSWNSNNEEEELGIGSYHGELEDVEVDEGDDNTFSDDVNKSDNILTS